MILLFTLIEIIIIIALLVIIAAAVAVLIIRLKKGGGGANSPAAKGIMALEDLEAKILAVRQAGSVTKGDCTELKNLILTARSNGVPSLTIDRLESEVNGLCPDN